jgi:hypothetical protein
MPEEKVTLKDDADVVAAWKGALALGRRMGLSLFKQACLSGAVLELSRNVIERGAKGSCALSDASDKDSLRARVVVEGCDPDLFSPGRGKLSREICVGPALPSVKLQQVVETMSSEPCEGGARLALTLQQPRVLAKPVAGRRPAALALERRR